MPVSDLVSLAYGLSTLVVVFLAGRLWGPGPTAALPQRLVGSVFAVAQVAVLVLSLAWNYDLFHRAFYMLYNLAVGSVVVAAWGLVLFAVKDRRGLPLYGIMGALAAFGLAATLWSIGGRETLGPPFAFVALCLLLAPALALAPRIGVRGYQIFRDREFAGWALLMLTGILGVAETVQLSPLVPGVTIDGRASFLHFFLAGLLVGGLLVAPRPRPVPLLPSEVERPLPWHLFNPAPSPREADLLSGLRRRLTNKELAAELKVSESTVKKHLASLFQKAGVEGRQRLIEKLDLEG